MKKVLILLIIFFVGVSTDALCQQSGKILVATRDSSVFTFLVGDSESGLNRMLTALSRYYTGDINIHFGLLPDSLEQYDAIFTDLRFLENDDSLLIAKELEKLSSYLLSVGKLYIELTQQTTDYKYFHYPSHAYDEYPPFNELSGIRDYGYFSIAVQGIDSIKGAKGSFAEGLSYFRKTYSTEINFGSRLDIGGDVVIILDGHGYLGSTLGWLHEKNNIKAVYHWPIVTDHYNEFIGRVVCNYFELCTPLAARKESTSNDGFSISNLFYHSDTKELSFDYILPRQEPLEFTMFNVLGERLFYSYGVEAEGLAGTLRLTIPKHLANGGYYLVVKTRDGVRGNTFLVVR